MIESNYSWLHMDKAVTASPEHQFFTAVNYRQSKFAAKLSGMYIHGLYTSITPEAIESYFLLNARVSYTFLDMLTLWVSGENLLDREYETNYAYPMPGIALIGGIDFNFNTRKK